MSEAHLNYARGSEPLSSQDAEEPPAPWRDLLEPLRGRRI
jgi:hypothetical protein